MGFQCSNMLTALPSAFLDRLLSAALMEDAEIRLFVLEILISFIDRHGNRQKFSTIRYVLGAPQQGWDPAEPGLGGRSAGLGALAGLLINPVPILGWFNAAERWSAESQMGGGLSERLCPEGRFFCDSVIL